MTDTTTTDLDLLRTPAAKVGMILLLILLMQLPMLLVGGLIQERQQRAEEVLTQFRHGWGPEQSLTGPMLMVPYSWTEGGQQKRSWAMLSPSKLDVTARLQPETRRRGLYQAVVYSALVDVSGSMAIPALELKDAVVDWPGARVVFSASDLRAMPADAMMDWNGAAVPLRSGGDCGSSLLNAPAGLSGAPLPGSVIPFKAALSLLGTQAFRLVPIARDVDLHIASSWRWPGFVGASLPFQYTLDKAGFDAEWVVPGNPASAGWHVRTDCGPGFNPGLSNPDSQIGVELREAVPTYVMVDRAAKYGVLFLALTYLTLFLFEALSGVPIHLVQYGLVGLSVSLFALLLISVAEPLGFTAAYVISSAAVMIQASLYTWSVVRRGLLAGIFAGVLGAVFGFLYVVLSLESYSLLTGSVVLFAVLSVVMAATNRVNWAGGRA